MKTVTLSLDLSKVQILANAFNAIGQGFLQVASVLGGKGSSKSVPVVPSQLAWSLTVLEVVNEFMLAKARANRSDRYLRQLHVSLGSFAKGRSKMPVTDVTTQEIEAWAAGNEWSARTMRGYISDVRTLFTFAINRGYAERNPAKGVELPVIEDGRAVKVHTPAQVRQVLDAARRSDLDICRQLAVRYFAGVRSAEMHRLRESDIKLDQGLIEVPAAKSKTRSRRLVTIQPNLRAWLDLGGTLDATGDMRIRRVLRASKVEWEHNVTRHSFCSYHLAHFKKANETSLEAGHSEQMLFKHYRAVVTPDQAKEFWDIRP